MLGVWVWAVSFKLFQAVTSIVFLCKANKSTGPFVVHPLVWDVLYEDWPCPKKVHSPHKSFTKQYPLKVESNSFLNKKRLEALLKAYFALWGLAMQLTVVSIAICWTLAVLAKCVAFNSRIDPLVRQKLEIFPIALHYCVNELTNCQNSHLALI